MSARTTERESAVAVVGSDWGDPAWREAARATAACRRCVSYTPLSRGGGWCAEAAGRVTPDSSCDSWTPNREGEVITAMEFRAAESAADAARHTCPACGEREAIPVLDFAPDGTTRDRGVCRNCDWRDA